MSDIGSQPTNARLPAAALDRVLVEVYGGGDSVNLTSSWQNIVTTSVSANGRWRIAAIGDAQYDDTAVSEKDVCRMELRLTRNGTQIAYAKAMGQLVGKMRQLMQAVGMHDLLTTDALALQMRATMVTTTPTTPTAGVAVAFASQCGIVGWQIGS